MQAEGGHRLHTVRFAPLVEQRHSPRAARFLLTTGLAAGLAMLAGPLPVPAFESAPDNTKTKRAGEVPRAAAASLAVPVRDAPADSPPGPSDDAAETPVDFTPLVRIELPVATAPAATQPTALAPIPAPLPEPEPAPSVPALAVTQPAEVPVARKVDIDQLAGETPRSPHVPQLLEPGLVAGEGATLVAKVDAMQVPLPAPAQLSGEERAMLLAEAPHEMTVRIGEEAVGTIAVRMTETRGIDVQLSGLLELVADRFAPEDYSRLRASAAADSFVPMDQVRAVGLSLRYDPVYDELRLGA